MLIRAALIFAAVYVTGEWIAGAAVAVLLLVWWLLSSAEGPPVLALALTYQWVQVSIGIFYSTLIGEPLEAMVKSDWQTMVLISLGCVVTLAISLSVGLVFMRNRLPVPESRPALAFSPTILYAAYGVSLLVTGVVQELAWQYPSITQAILALNFSHLALVFLLARRFTRPVFAWEKLAALMALEVALGFTGYFANFREPLLMGAIALVEVFDRRDSRHWAFFATVVVVLGVSSVVWMNVRGELRRDVDEEIETTRMERLDKVRALSEGLFSPGGDFRESTTRVVERVWAIYFPALAVERVPSVLPHTNGAIIEGALTHLITPRFFFPDKGDLPSDSEMVRKYSGMKVASTEENTSIAFGYAAESYVDFGLPWMFIPALIYGLLMGAAYQTWLTVIRHRELAVSLVTVIFWLSLYLFERSWIKTMGLAVTLMVYLGGLSYLIDRYLLTRRAQTERTEAHNALLETPF
jgi:uncharacterized membrane protein AbrB (regulator of aidB expression)